MKFRIIRKKFSAGSVIYFPKSSILGFTVSTETTRQHESFVYLVYQPGHSVHLWVPEEFPGQGIRPSDVLIFSLDFIFNNGKIFNWFNSVPKIYNFDKKLIVKQRFKTIFKILNKKSIYLIASNFSKLWSASSASFLIRSFLPSCASFRRSNSRAFEQFSFD